MGKTGRTTGMMDGYHKSVLLKEVLRALNVEKGKWYLDCTLGDGGYTLKILEQGGKVLGLDVDPEAISRTKGRIGSLGEKEFIQGNFRDIKNLISQTEFAGIKFAGAIFDLGVSSLQLEDSERGFSFGKEGPLDMRMDPSLSIRAWDLVNNLSRKELYEIFNKFGEEKHSWELANVIVSTRKIKLFSTTTELAEVVKRAIRGNRQDINPATRIFQALRIFVNDELGALQEGIESTKEIIEKNGCIIIISFHSLEDRIVKFAFREWEVKGLGQILTQKPIIPSAEEIEQNSRSRSAKMRVFKKI